MPEASSVRRLPPRALTVPAAPQLSHLGSKAAVERFMEVAASSDSAPERAAIEAWVDAARERVLEEAATQGVAPRQLACTLLVALAGDDWAAFAQIGDGVIVFNGGAGYELAFWPDNGEYANTTRFLTDDDYRKHLRIEVVTRKVSELAVMTDGLQMLALDFKGGRVHERFLSLCFARSVTIQTKRRCMPPCCISWTPSG